MKKLFAATLILTTFLHIAPTFATSQSDCDLLQNMTGETSFGEDNNLSDANPAAIASLSPMAQKQLITYARNYADTAESRLIKTAKEAVVYLTEGSEGSELYLNHFSYGGRKYTKIDWYPGGNPYSVIYAYGTVVQVATLEDGDFLCSL